jgi:AcrR family transcriptional regulator
VRTRIVRAAAEVVARCGVAGATVERVCAASGVSRSQVRRHFPAEGSLLDAVVDLHVTAVLTRQHAVLVGLASPHELHAWVEDLVESSRGCRSVGRLPLGFVVTQLAERSDAARVKLDDAFRAWQSYLASALGRMQEGGALDPAADPGELAVGVVAALQGGPLMAQVARSDKPLRTALELAVGSIVGAAPVASRCAPRGGRAAPAPVPAAPVPGAAAPAPHGRS